MESGEFESLSKKVELAVSVIGQLKSERDSLSVELKSFREQAQSLKTELVEKTGELETLRKELARKSENISQASEHVRNLVSPLEAALT